MQGFFRLFDMDTTEYRSITEYACKNHLETRRIG